MLQRFTHTLQCYEDDVKRFDSFRFHVDATGVHNVNCVHSGLRFQIYASSIKKMSISDRFQDSDEKTNQKAWVVKNVIIFI